MKQFVAILLLLVYTCTGTALQQLQKIPVFFEHYREHQALNKDITVSEFVVIHYFSGNVKDADYARDMQLPFKTSDFFSSATAQIFIPASFPDICFTPALSPHIYSRVFNDRLIPFRYSSNIWQPPKSC